jgi:tRNA nucleotidyltransferase/poly(A) polymerase
VATTERDAFVECFRQSGHQLWVVGGALRDRELDLPARGDID